MLILDDLLLSPVRGIGWIFRQVQEAARQELERMTGQTRAELAELYAEFESGRITEAEFDERERRLLDRLEELEGS